MKIIETLPLFRSTLWQESTSNSNEAIALFKNHYSADNSKIDKWAKHGFVGPGETMTLLTPTNDALFVWRHQLYRADNQHGIECAVFRNESEHQSSALIKQAMQLAKMRWGELRLFTFVNPRRIRSSNPGYCYKCAGWVQSGISLKLELVILEYVYES